MTQEIAQAPVVGCKRVAKTDNAGSHAKVYFTKHIDAEHLIKLYNLINESIYGKVAIKLHTGEKHGPAPTFCRASWSKHCSSKSLTAPS